MQVVFSLQADALLTFVQRKYSDFLNVGSKSLI